MFNLKKIILFVILFLLILDYLDPTFAIINNNSRNRNNFSDL